MRRGPLPRPERHRAHRARREVSCGVRLEPFFGRSGHLLAWHISPLRWGKGGVFCRAWDQPRAVRDEQHVYDHLLWPGQLSTEFSTQFNVSRICALAALLSSLCCFLLSTSYCIYLPQACNLFKVTFDWFPITVRVLCDLSTEFLYYKQHNAAFLSFNTMRNCSYLELRCLNRWSSTQGHLSHMRFRPRSNLHLLWCSNKFSQVRSLDWGLLYTVGTIPKCDWSAAQNTCNTRTRLWLCSHHA